MPIVICAWTGEEMLIDEPGGVAYITHADGKITRVATSKEEALENAIPNDPPIDEETSGDIEQPLEQGE
jgi:hypothetical protein